MHVRSDFKENLKNVSVKTQTFPCFNETQHLFSIIYYFLFQPCNKYPTLAKIKNKKLAH